MAYQTQFEGYVALKKQTGLGAIASGTGATILPIVSGSAKTAKTAISSKQIRQDGQALRGRHGQQGFEASYNGELQLGNFDDALASVLRNNWGTTGAAITTGTIGATGKVITFAGYNPLTAGAVKVYDILYFSTGLAVADQNKPLRVTAIDATSITVAETLTTVAGGATYSMAVKGRKLVCGAAGDLVKNYFTLEEAETAIDASTVAQDVMFGKFSLQMQADNMMNVTVGLMGTGNVQALEGAEAPYFTAPVETPQTLLSVIDATIRFGNGDVLDLESLSLDLDLGLSKFSGIGTKFSPDVFPGVLKVSGSVTALRKDLSYYAGMLNESSYSLCILAVVPGTSPAQFINIVVPYFSLGTVDPSDFSREGGPRTQTINIPAELVGIDITGAAYDKTMVKFQQFP